MEKKINEYGCWLAQIGGIGAVTIRALMRHALSAEEIYVMRQEELEMILKEELSGPSDAVKKAKAIQSAKAQEPARIAEQLIDRGIGFTCAEDDDFPQRLRHIPDNPYCLYYIGSLPADDVPAVAIVGARNCSGYGREQARLFAQRLVMRGVNVVSGMARGVDGIAGRAAADSSGMAGGRSYAVLGGGVDIIYPAENRDLYHMLAHSGGILSESVPGTQPRTQLFPRRNRIISGLADMVLVIEARQRSGTIITVDAALEQGREIFALPGRVSDSLSDGCNLLIKQGASIACSPDDVLEHLFGVSQSYTDLSNQQRIAREQRGSDLPPLERALFEALGCGEIMETEYLWHRAEQMLGQRFDLSEVMAAMMQLQIRGMAVEIGMSHFKGV